MSYRSFHRSLRSNRARYYLADFHVHGPGSYDLSSDDRLAQLSEEDRVLINSIPSGLPLRDHEQAALTKFPPATFLQRLISRRDCVLESLGTEEREDWAFVAVTDHNVCEYACALGKLAWEARTESRLVVLPGIELSATYPLPDGGSAAAHLICVFAPGIDASSIRLAITQANGNGNWEFGGTIQLNSLPDFVLKLRAATSSYPAICIAAHVGSSSGVQSETRNAILSRREAAISRIRGELAMGLYPACEDLERQLSALENEEVNGDAVASEVLTLVGNCGFDALQVRDRRDEVHYRRLHRFREDCGRAVPIVCSDAHGAQDAFSATGGVPFLKLSGIGGSMLPDELHSEIRRALRFGETRFSSSAPETPTYWLSGLRISPDSPDSSAFWPFTPTEGVHCLTLPLSRNLNCFIGGRGSGKSATLEAIAFVAGAGGFDNINPNKSQEWPESYARANATLSGCKITACWQFTSQESASTLQKKALVGTRFFDPGHRHRPTEYSSITGTPLVQQQVPDNRIQVFRLGEIEQHAAPERLRGLFDDICGTEISECESSISPLLGDLEKNRTHLVKLATEIVSLTKDAAPLREYAKRKSLLDRVNTPEIVKAYDEIDSIANAENTTKKAVDAFKASRTKFFPEAETEEFTSFFESFSQECLDTEGQIRPHHEALYALVKVSGNDEEESCKSRDLLDDVRGLTGRLDSYLGELTAVEHEVQELGRAEKEKLEATGVPLGASDRESKKISFDDAVDALEQYKEFLAKWERAYTERKGLRKTLDEQISARASLRQRTASELSARLEQDLDVNVLVVAADAQTQADKSALYDWMNRNFARSGFRYREARFNALIEGGLEHRRLRSLLLDDGTENCSLLVVDRERADHGAIAIDVATEMLSHYQAKCRLDPEADFVDSSAETREALPAEIREGLITFPPDSSGKVAGNLDAALRLDEIVFEDNPVILLNDRPLDAESVLRPLTELSRGQRCSAILPILLLTGTCPVLIDQPEDNLDNRLIRQVVVNILASMKLRRQVILATHNANLPVLGDVEQAVVLQGVRDKACEVKVSGDLDQSEVIHLLTEVMEGGREAFQYRQSIYQEHWPGPVSGD